MVSITLTMHSKQPKRAMISADKAYIEIMEYPRADSCTHRLDRERGWSRRYPLARGSLPWAYVMSDLEAAAAGDAGALAQIETSADVMALMTRLRRDWGLQISRGDGRLSGGPLPSRASSVGLWDSFAVPIGFVVPATFHQGQLKRLRGLNRGCRAEGHRRRVHRLRDRWQPRLPRLPRHTRPSTMTIRSSARSWPAWVASAIRRRGDRWHRPRSRGRQRLYRACRHRTHRGDVRQPIPTPVEVRIYLPYIMSVAVGNLLPTARSSQLPTMDTFSSLVTRSPRASW